jgi:hypothetical protein
MSTSTKMRGSVRERLLLAVLLSIAAVSAGYAASGENGYPQGATYVAQGYMPDSQQAPKRTALTVADTRSLTTANLTALRGAGAVVHVNGRPNFSVSVRFSKLTDTATLQLAYVYRQPPGVGTADYLLGVGPTFSVGPDTTNPVTDQNGKYLAPSLVFDSFGATDVFPLVVVAPASGNVDIGPGTY